MPALLLPHAYTPRPTPLCHVVVSWPLCGPFYLNVLQNVHVDFLFNFVFDFHYSSPTIPHRPHPSLPHHASSNPFHWSHMHTNHPLTHSHTLLSLAPTTHCVLVLALAVSVPHRQHPIDIDIATTCGHLQMQLQLKSPKLTKQNCVRMDKLVNCQYCHVRRAPRSLCRWRRRKSSTSSPQTPRPSLSTPIVSSTWRCVTLPINILFSINLKSFSFLG